MSTVTETWQGKRIRGDLCDEIWTIRRKGLEVKKQAKDCPSQNLANLLHSCAYSRYNTPFLQCRQWTSPLQISDKKHCRQFAQKFPQAFIQRKQNNLKFQEESRTESSSRVISELEGTVSETGDTHRNNFETSPLTHFMAAEYCEYESYTSQPGFRMSQVA